jgi:DNA-binding ferritin-like protein (Dps family)
VHTRYSDWIKIGENMDNKGSKSDKPKLMVVKPQNNLTAKQERFSQLVAQGSMSYSQAYRESGYSVENMKAKSVNELASRLLVKVRWRVDEIISSNIALSERKEETLKTYIENKLMEIVENSDQDSAKVSSLALLGRSIAMFSDKVIEETQDESIYELEKKLKDKLDKLKIL